MRIAIVGAGISGLAAAHLLAQRHEVALFEREPRLGGHSSTETVTLPEGEVPVDMGFIVYNHRNYPLLTALFRHLEVPTAESDMSFGVSAEDGRIEYSTRSLPSMFAQPSNLLRPAFLGMLLDIARFGRRARRFLEADADLTMSECLDRLGLGEWFRRHYLLAMGGAIWDTAPSRMLEFPARTFMRFFDNHGLLSVGGHPQWRTVRGGSREYVGRLARTLGGRVRAGRAVTRVARRGEGVEISTDDGSAGEFDIAVLACHSDQSLGIIESPTEDERAILGAVRYWPNRTVLHSDPSFMPRRRGAWASWVYLSENTGDGGPRISLSYWMNSLQPLGTETPLIVTLNPAREPRPELVHKERMFEHPALDRGAIGAQARICDIQGRDRLWFCGAWQRYGFHEDGLSSAVAVAKALGCEVPWE